jgi:hypothetical protein
MGELTAIDDDVRWLEQRKTTGQCPRARAAVVTRRAGRHEHGGTIDMQPRRQLPFTWLVWATA